MNSRVLSLFLIVTTATAFGASSRPIDRDSAIVGKWLVENPHRAPRVVVFHADHTWAVINSFEREEISGRRWHIRGNELTLRYPGNLHQGHRELDTTVDTIVSFQRDRFITDAFTYTRIE